MRDRLIRHRSMFGYESALRPKRKHGGGGDALENGSSVAVVGGGPAGSLFGYFLLDMAQRADITVNVDIYEPQNFFRTGPAGCNMCGGIMSESLVQTLAAEGINLPDGVVRRGIDSYVLHMDEGNVRIDTLHEKRIAAVFRGAGPRGLKEIPGRSFDGYLLELVTQKGARLIRNRAERVSWQDGRPCIWTRDGTSQTYDLLTVAVGINTQILKMFEELVVRYKSPRTTKAHIAEFYLGQQTVERHLGSSMHVFLLNIPRLEFAALIPKGDYVTLCLLGRGINSALVQSFLESTEVKQCFPQGWRPPQMFCHCAPRISVGPAVMPFADRLVFIGDCGITRLYKDGIGAAYRTAKAAAVTAVFSGVSARDFRHLYWPTCVAINTDNKIGQMIFWGTRLVQKMRFARQGILYMVSREQLRKGRCRHMSLVLWDTFTGSAPYRDIFLRALRPSFLAKLFWSTVAGFGLFYRDRFVRSDTAKKGVLGRMYRDGDLIIQEGETGNCMYVIQAGKAEVFQQKGARNVRLALLGEGDFFGEMALFEREVRSASVRAFGDVRMLTVDKRTFLQRIHEDPSLAFRIMQMMSHRIRELNAELPREQRDPLVSTPDGSSQDKAG